MTIMVRNSDNLLQKMYETHYYLFLVNLDSSFFGNDTLKMRHRMMGKFIQDR